MKINIFYLLFFTSLLAPLKVSALCSNPEVSGFGEASGLSEMISKTPIVNFSPGFCQAFTGCTEFSRLKADEDKKKQMIVYFQTLSESIDKTQSHLQVLQKQETMLKEADPVDHFKLKKTQSEIKGAEQALLGFKTDHEKYQRHLKDPAANLNPLLEKGIGLSKEQFQKFTEESIAIEEDKKRLEREEYYSQLAENVDLLKKSIEQKEKASKVDYGDIPALKTSLKIMETDLAKLNKHLKDPKIHQHPMKLEGIGLTSQEKKEKLKKEIEQKYEDNQDSIQNTIAEIAGYKKELKKLGKSPDAKELKDEIKDEEGYLKHLMSINKKYQAFKKNPAANPKFLDVDPFDDDEEIFEIDGSCKFPTNKFKESSNTFRRNKAGTCGLTPEEFVLLKYYTDDGYDCMNGYLRQSAIKIPELDQLVKTLNKGLEKLPSFQGFVKRGASLPESIRQQHKSGAIVTYGSYTSTSTSGGFGGLDTFYIYSVTGKPIMSFSDHTDENEVLFKAGTKFKVLDTKSKSGHYYIMMEVGEKGTTEAEEREILEAFHKHTNSEAKPDKFLCPIKGNKKLPKVVKQKGFPEMTYPKSP